MYVVSFILAGIALIYYVLSPSISQDGEVSTITFNKLKAGYLIGLIAVCFLLFFWLEPRYGYDEDILIINVIVLVASTLLLLISLVVNNKKSYWILQQNLFQNNAKHYGSKRKN